VSSTEAPVRVLFVMSTLTAYFRFFEAPFRLLLARGHEVHIAVGRAPDADEEAWLRALAGEQGRLTWGRAPFLKHDPWGDVARDVVLARDYVHALRPRFAEAPSLVDRVRKRTPVRFRRFLERPLARSAPSLALLDAGLRTVEAAIPTPQGLEEYIAARRPDVLLLAPHLFPGSRDGEYIEAAHAVGVPSAICVASWDNLSSKQLIRGVPDAVMVWNEIQRREAIELHGIPAGRVIVTGAQCYDHWFSWRARPREDFCRRVGLDPRRPFLLYVGGALFPADITEPEFVRGWIARVRASEDAELRTAGILIRPHPKRGDEWRDVDLTEVDAVAVWPPGGRMPVAEQDRQDFYDSIHHSAGVVGVNTSAMIEAGIVGRPVHTLYVPEFSGSQQGTLHFRYLMEAGGGLLRVAHDFDDHLRQLADAVRRRGEAVDHATFLQAFVRPHGVGVPVTPIFVDAVVRLAHAGRRRPVRPPRRLAVVRVPLQYHAQRRLWRRVAENALRRAEQEAAAAAGRGTAGPAAAPAGTPAAAQGAATLPRVDPASTDGQVPST
jgi:hypothetical protein